MESMRPRIIQGVSFSPNDPLIPKVKALVRERRFSEVCRQALRAWFEKEDRDAVLDTLRRIESKLESWRGADPSLHEVIVETVYGPAIIDAEGTDAAAVALDS